MESQFQVKVCGLTKLNQIKELINEVTKLAETPAMEKYILSDVNKLLAGSNSYNLAPIISSTPFFGIKHAFI